MFWGVRYLGSRFNEREQIDMQKQWCETRNWHKEGRQGNQRAIGHTDLRRHVPQTQGSTDVREAYAYTYKTLHTMAN